MKPDWFTIQNQKMKTRFILFRRGDVYYCEDTVTRKQVSLRTKNENEAITLLHVKNESFRQPILNLQIARTYLTATDPEVAKRTWQTAMDELTKTKSGNTRYRHETAMKDKAFDLIRNLPILETQSAHFLKTLELGSVSTNVYLRRIHNFALDMNWLPWSVLPKRQWPKVKFKDKRAIKLEEHERIVPRLDDVCPAAIWPPGRAGLENSVNGIAWGQAILFFCEPPFFVELRTSIDRKPQYWNAAAELAEGKTCAPARTEGFDEGWVLSDVCFPQTGFALSGNCAENKSHTFPQTHSQPYRCAATSIEGFVQQLAVAYVARGYWFYVAGTVPGNVDPRRVDEKLIAKYKITGSKRIRSKQKRAGLARIQYLRFGSFFLLLATAGEHKFLREETTVRDVRRHPIRFGGYSISYRQGRDRKWHASVRIEKWEFRLLKRRFVEMATKTSLNFLIARLAGLGFAPYAPVRDQYRLLLRKVNRARRLAGLDPVPPEVLPRARRVVKPFG